MIQVFVKTGCPFCAKVLTVLDAYGLEYKERNVSDQKNVEELIRLGGKKQEPFMVDGETMLYESVAIIDYIEKCYGGAGRGKPKIHFVADGGVCPAE